MHRCQALFHSLRSLRRNHPRNLLAARHHLIGRDDFFYQPNTQCLERRNHLTCKQQLKRCALAHQPRQPLRSAITGQQAKFYLWLSKLRRLARNTKRTGQSQLTPSTERKAVHAGNHRLAAALNAVKQALSAQRQCLSIDRRNRRQLLNISPGSKGLLPGTCEEDGTNSRIGNQLSQRRIQLTKSSSIQCIENFRTVQGKDSDRLTNFNKDIFVVHSERVSLARPPHLIQMW